MHNPASGGYENSDGKVVTTGSPAAYDREASEHLCPRLALNLPLMSISLLIEVMNYRHLFAETLSFFFALWLYHMPNT